MSCFFVFFFNASATPELHPYYTTLSLHDALPISYHGLIKRRFRYDEVCAALPSAYERRRSPSGTSRNATIEPACNSRLQAKSPAEASAAMVRSGLAPGAATARGSCILRRQTRPLRNARQGGRTNDARHL